MPTRLIQIQVKVNKKKAFPYQVTSSRASTRVVYFCLVYFLARKEFATANE